MDEAQHQARHLLQAADQGGAGSRLRRAREALLQAGSSAEEIEQIGLESAILALGQALDHAGLRQAAQRCCDLSATYRAQIDPASTGLAALNSWVYPRCLRRYQLDILEGRSPEIELAGETYRLQDCHADADRNHLLLQQLRDGSLWWLSSGECSDGYQLDGTSLKLAEEGSTHGGISSAVVRCGNSNFAHFLWNELDPLLRLSEAGYSLDVVQDTDTVLDLAKLDGLHRMPTALLKERRSVRLGCTLVTNQARRTVLQALVREVEKPLPIDRPQPLVLLGVRGPGRRELRNEVEFLSALIDAITQHFHRPLILLDGFTYQHNNQDQPQAQQREQACTARVQQILANCKQAQLESLSGLDFASWLQRSEGVRFYVTHEGTMQHKLGWLRPEIPGLCLIGSARAEAIATWHRLQCEGAQTPATLPTSLYQQDPLKADQAEEEERNQPFQILDIDRAVNLTMQHIKAELELARGTNSHAAH